MCKISILMSVYNEKKEWLEKSIESILNQTFDDFEFIIYDDCTNDENKKILNSYACKDKRIKIITNSTNRGLTYNLNKGIEIAKGEYIARMDSDDISKINRLERQVSYMEKHTDVVLLGTHVKRLGINTKKHRRVFVPSAYLKVHFLFNNMLPHPTAIMRRDFLIQNSLNYDVEIKKSQDYDLWTRIIQKGRAVFLPYPLVYYRVHDAQISNDKTGEQRKYRDIVRLRQLEYLDIKLDAKEKQIYLDFCEGKLWENVKEYRAVIYNIFREISKQRQYNIFFLWYKFNEQYFKCRLRGLRK